MRYWIKVFGLVLLAAVLMGIAFIAGTVLQPRPILKAWTLITERTESRQRAESDQVPRQGLTPEEAKAEAGRSLRQGMAPETVKVVLGEPSKVEEVNIQGVVRGMRWFYYFEFGDYIVVEFLYCSPPNFKMEPRLCYAHRKGAGMVRYFGDTDPKYFTIGKPLESH